MLTQLKETLVGTVKGIIDTVDEHVDTMTDAATGIVEKVRDFLEHDDHDDPGCSGGCSHCHHCG